MCNMSKIRINGDTTGRKSEENRDRESKKQNKKYEIM